MKLSKLSFKLVILYLHSFIALSEFNKVIELGIPLRIDILGIALLNFQLLEFCFLDSLFQQRYLNVFQINLPQSFVVKKRVLILRGIYFVLAGLMLLLNFVKNFFCTIHFLLQGVYPDSVIFFFSLELLLDLESFTVCIADNRSSSRSTLRSFL